MFFSHHLHRIVVGTDPNRLRATGRGRVRFSFIHKVVAQSRSENTIDFTIDYTIDSTLTLRGAVVYDCYTRTGVISWDSSLLSPGVGPEGVCDGVLSKMVGVGFGVRVRVRVWVRVTFGLGLGLRLG